MIAASGPAAFAGVSGVGVGVGGTPPRLPRLRRPLPLLLGTGAGVLVPGLLVLRRFAYIAT